MKVLIVGGGITGLTLALSLAQAGVDCEVCEAVDELRPLGVGINLLPHAVRELTELGLQGKLAAVAIETAELIYYTRRGQEIWREDRGLAAGYKWPQYSIHRGELQMLLYDAATQLLGADKIHLDQRVTSVIGASGEATAIFIDSAGEERTRTADVIVAADGIHSTVRRQFYPDEGTPKWNGCILWRGTTLGEPFLTGRSMIMAGDAAQKFVCYPISREAAVAGKSLINWIAEIRVDDQSMLEREDWNREGELEDFLPAFEGWAFEGLNIPEIISRNRGVYEFPMVDHDPLPAWTFKNITLAGDAAHPMYPIGSNGASQGILDARCLSYCLATQRSIPAAQSLYEDERRLATSRVVLANRENGPERIMQLVRDRAPQGFDSIDDVVSREDREAVASQYKKIAGFDPQELNRRRSFSAAQAAKAPD